MKRCGQLGTDVRSGFNNLNATSISDNLLMSYRHRCYTSSTGAVTDVKLKT